MSALTVADQVKSNLLEMQEVLDNNTAGLPSLLRTIHGQLKSDPEIVTLLSDDECNILVEGLKSHTSTELACKAMKGKTRTALKQTTMADL